MNKETAVALDVFEELLATIERNEEIGIPDIQNWAHEWRKEMEAKITLAKLEEA